MRPHSQHDTARLGLPSAIATLNTGDSPEYAPEQENLP
jgi:hypothetical protein